MRYLKGTIDYGLRYASDREIILQRFTDSNWVGSVADQKSTYGCCFSMSRYMVESRHVHLIVAKHVMMYLKGTIDYGLRYTSDRERRLQGFTDSDWAGSVVDRKSTFGCCFNMGSTMISWFNRMQTCWITERGGESVIEQFNQM
jgi:hypothetical protein